MFSTSKEHLRKQAFIYTNLNVVLYALCFWIQIGTLPFITKSMGVNSVTFGYLQTVFAVVQLAGGPVFGRLGDLFGSRNAMILSFLSAFFSYLLLGSAKTVTIVFLSRLPSIFMHSMQAAQMVITDITSYDQRSTSLGRLSISYGLGMVVGPVVGGFCVKHASEQAAAYVAAFGSLASVIISYFCIPKDTKALRVKKEDSVADSEIKLKQDKHSFFNLALFKRLVLKNQPVRNIMLVKLVSGLPIGVFHSMFSLIMMEHFTLSADLNGYVLSFIGVITMLTQGFVLDWIKKQGYSDVIMVKMSVVVLTASYALLAFVAGKSIWLFCVVTLPMVMSGAVYTTATQTLLTKHVSSADTGSILGFSMATNSLIRSISPFIGGYMFQSIGFSSFGCLGFICNGLLSFYLFKINTSFL